MSTTTDASRFTALVIYQDRDVFSYACGTEDDMAMFCDKFYGPRGYTWNRKDGFATQEEACAWAQGEYHAGKKKHILPDWFKKRKAH